MGLSIFGNALRANLKTLKLMQVTSWKWRSMVPKPMLCLMAIACGLLGPGPARSENDGFRVESKVFVGSEKEPKSENTTIFSKGVIYDYLKTPAETIVLDPARGRFILLDPNRRLRTELSTQEVLALTENLRQWAATQTDAFTRFLAAPSFEEQFDERTGEVILQSPWVTYRAAMIEPDNEAMAQQYREFCDWYTRLNARLTPGYKLVFARLAFNEAIQKRRQLPKEINLTVQLKKVFGTQKTVVRSEHQFVSHLVESDRDRITQTSQYMAIFQPVDFTEYSRKPEP